MGGGGSSSSNWWWEFFIFSDNFDIFFTSGAHWTMDMCKICFYHLTSLPRCAPFSTNTGAEPDYLANNQRQPEPDYLTSTRWHSMLRRSQNFGKSFPVPGEYLACPSSGLSLLLRSLTFLFLVSFFLLVIFFNVVLSAFDFHDCFTAVPNSF